MRRKPKKVVVIGGGTGTYQVLVGLKSFPHTELAAVVTMADSGGSAGRLRREFGMLPPGDVRRALLALSNLPLSQKTLERLFDFRFENGEQLKGHSFGNLILAALTQITGRADKAIGEAGRILAVSGRVLPVTLKRTHLCAVLTDGTRIFGETNIDIREKKPDIPIKKVYLTPAARIFREAEEAICHADLVVLGPGDLYSSIIPNLLVRGVTEAIEECKGKVAVVVNLMTKHGETDGFTALRFVKEIKNYLGKASDKITHVVVNKEIQAPRKITAWYKKFQSEPIKDDLDNELSGVKIIRGNFVDSGTFLRHDPRKLARVLVEIL